MAIFKSIFLFFVLLFSCVFVGYSQSNLPCVEQLLPCQPYLNGAAPPSPSCCVPLKQIVSTQVQCLCQVFNNVAIMKSLNVTQADALKLVKSCGANADASLCNTAATPPGPPSTPSSSNSSTTSTPPPPPHNKNAASTISHVGWWSLSVTAILSFIVLAFQK